jgi:chitin synthase
LIVLLTSLFCRQYMLMIDADTVVDPFSLNYLVGSFVQDKKGELLCSSSLNLR